MNAICQHCGSEEMVILSELHKQVRCFKCAALGPGEPAPKPEWASSSPALAELAQRMKLRTPVEFQMAANKVKKNGKLGTKTVTYLQGLRDGMKFAVKILDDEAKAMADMAAGGKGR